MSLRIQELLEFALERTRSTELIAIGRVTHSANLRWANNTLTTNGVMHRVQISIIAFHATSAGLSPASVSGTASTLDDVAALVDQADAAAAAGSPATDSRELVPEHTSADYDRAPPRTDIGVYAEVAPRLGEAFMTAQAAGRVLYGFVDHEMATTYLASSTGHRLRHRQPTGHWGCTGKDAATLTNSAWVGGATQDFADLDPLAMEVELATRLGWGERRLALPPGRYDTVLPPTAVADLLIYAYWVAGARAAADRQSVFSRPGGGTRIGERLSRHPVQMFSDPSHPGQQAIPFVVTASSGESTSVFDNGLPLSRTDWISTGTMAALIQTRETAAETGQPVTPAIDNLIVEVDGASARTDDLVTGVERGLLLTCLWYIREVDPQTLLLTGLTRDGVYLVEGGEVVGAVNNFRFNESPISLLDRFTQASRSTASFSREWGDYFPRTVTPALRVPDFNMSSSSDAS